MRSLATDSLSRRDSACQRKGSRDMFASPPIQANPSPWSGKKARPDRGGSLSGLGIPDESGRLRWQRRVISGNVTATYPVLASVEDGMVAAWVHDTGAGPGIRVERIVTTN